MSLEGIDVSHWQDNIVWPEVSRHKTFALAKVSQGVGYRDPKFKRNQRSATAAGILFGSYHYADGSNVKKEVSNYLKALDGYRRPGEVMALDVEGSILSKRGLVSWCEKWVNGVKAETGTVPILYMSRSTTGRFNWKPLVEANSGLWVAAWGDDMGSPKHWDLTAFWQYSSTGSVPGVSGNCDLDKFFGSPSAFKKYGGIKDVNPNPPSDPQPAGSKKIQEAVRAVIPEIADAVVAELVERLDKDGR